MHQSIICSKGVGLVSAIHAAWICGVVFTVFTPSVFVLKTPAGYVFAIYTYRAYFFSQSLWWLFFVSRWVVPVILVYNMYNTAYIEMMSW